MAQLVESPCNAGDLGSIPGSGRSPGEGNGITLATTQYSSLENPTDRGAWQVAIHGVARSWTQLSDFHFTFSAKCYIILFDFVRFNIYFKSEVPEKKSSLK